LKPITPIANNVNFVISLSGVGNSGRGLWGSVGLECESNDTDIDETDYESNSMPVNLVQLLNLLQSNQMRMTSSMISRYLTP